MSCRIIVPDSHWSVITNTVTQVQTWVLKSISVFSWLYECECVCGVPWLYAGSHWGSKSSQCSCINCSWAVRAARPVYPSTSTLFTLPPDTYTLGPFVSLRHTHLCAAFSNTPTPNTHIRTNKDTHMTLI